MTTRLTGEEEAMLRGDRGEAVQFAMEAIVRLARGFGAEELVEVVSVHAMAMYGDIHDAGLDLLERLHRLGGRCGVPTTQDPASISFKYWQRRGIPAPYAEKQLRLARLVEALGQRLIWSCTPYAAGNTPAFGQNVAWAESSAVSFANSVLGARTNRTPASWGTMDTCYTCLHVKKLTAAILTAGGPRWGDRGNRVGTRCQERQVLVTSPSPCLARPAWMPRGSSTTSWSGGSNAA